MKLTKKGKTFAKLNALKKVPLSQQQRCMQDAKDRGKLPAQLVMRIYDGNDNDADK